MTTFDHLTQPRVAQLFSHNLDGGLEELTERISWVINPVLCRWKRVRIKRVKSKAKHSLAFWDPFKTLQGHCYEHAPMTPRVYHLREGRVLVDSERHRRERGRKGLGRLCINRETQKEERLPIPRRHGVASEYQSSRSLEKKWERSLKESVWLQQVKSWENHVAMEMMWSKTQRFEWDL